MARLCIDDVALRFGPKRGNEVTALERISLDVADQEFAVIVGPSGCGKTSLLRLVAGLIEPTQGSITLDGTRVTGPGRDRGMVFQSYTLFPWLTVRDNVEFGLKIAGVSPAERARVAGRFISEVGLEGFEDAYPKHLSGGMMQRVALARALANDPAILLGDRVHVMTARPGRIKECIEVKIARPRSADTLTSAEFIAIKRRIMALIHDEAVRAIR